MTAFLLPSEVFNNQVPDSAYDMEYNLLKSKDFKVYLLDIEDILNNKIWPKYEGEDILYRGWMLNEEKYAQLNNKVNNNLVVSPKEYLHNHHIVNWYDSIKDDTFETHFTTLQEAEKTFSNLGWKQAFVKDYVKSIKTGKGSIIENASDIDRIKSDMLQFKGFIEGGLVLRKVEDFDKNSETRFFVLNGQIFSPKDIQNDMKKLVEKVSDIHKSFFYTVDIVQQNTGYKIIEIGDGQVADCVGYNVNHFIEIFDSLNNQNKLKIKM